MYNNRQYNDSIKNDLYDKISLSCTPQSEIRKSKTERKNSGATILSLDTNKKNNWNPIEKYEASHIGEYSGTTTPSCTSSTDSGVNIGDCDEITPTSSMSSQLHSFRPSIVSSETNTAVTLDYDNVHVNNKNPSQYNNIQLNKDSNCIIINNHKNNCIFNGYNDVDHDDGFDDVNSENFDNKKFKVLVDCGNGSKSTRYQTNQNIIESKNAINISQQPNLTTLARNDKKSLHHNEFNNLQQRPASPALSLSMSSTSNCGGNSPSKKHQYNNSPVVSIRSISSAIITSDSDSDHSSDSEGVHDNYVIKKLGTQVTYSPNDPSIPNINSGHTVLNQKVIANNDKVPLALDALAAIGDNIGAAHALGQGSSIGAAPQRPQIGSIAVSNSSDVTFGDKHFYEGPVTIQQFLIDTQDKWKETNGTDNPAFVEENINAKDINSSPEKSSKLYKYMLKRRKMVIPGVLAFMALLIVASVFASKTLNDSKNTNNNHDDDDHECEGNGTLCLIDRDVWRAHPQKSSLDKQVLPLHRVVISHTASEPCDSIKICVNRIRVIQEFHMNSLGWDDIAYNFLISSDGRVYVGRGWDFVGAHTKGYNYDSVGIAFIGTYISTAPTEAQLEACLALLQEGLHLNKLSPDYRVYGARQLGATESPGDMLYRRIKKWKHWSPNIDLNTSNSQ